MSALSAPRNTPEILCHTQKIRRIRSVKSGVTVYPGSIVAIDPSTDKAEPASDKAGLIVLGRAEGFTTDGRVIIKSGVFKFDCGTSTEALSASEINKKVFVLDDHTVGKVGGTNTVAAGILRDLDNLQAIVEIGNQVTN